MSVLVGYWQKLLAKLIPYRGTTYRKIGGAKGVSALVDEFYHIMSSDPKAKDCFLTHAGRDISDSSTKLKAFLSGWLGGPPVYMETYGHPRLRMRHFPFAIGAKEAQQWLYCMDQALKNKKVNPKVHQELMEAFKGVTTVIKNRD